MAATRFDPEVPKQIIQRCKGKMIAALVDPQAYSELAYYPLSLSIRDPEALYMLCVGKLSIVVAIDTGVVKEKLEANRISLEVIGNNEDYAISVRHVQPVDNQPDKIKIGNHIFHRLFAEFMSLDWIVQYIVTSMNTDTLIKLEAS